MGNPFLVFTGSEIKYLIAIFILGMILGATCLNLYMSDKIDQLVYAKKELENKLQESNKQIENLEKSLKKQKHSFIRKIEIKLESDLNKHTRQTIEKNVNNLLNSTVGKEISKLDPDLIIDIINERYVKIEDKNYHLKLNYMIVTETLKLNIKVLN